MDIERQQENQESDLGNHRQMIIDKIAQWAAINGRSFDIFRRIMDKGMLSGKTLLPRRESFWLVAEFAESNTTQVQRFAKDLEEEQWFNPARYAQLPGRPKGTAYTVDQTAVLLIYTSNISRFKTNGLRVNEEYVRQKEDARQKLIQNLKTALEGDN